MNSFNFKKIDSLKKYFFISISLFLLSIQISVQAAESLKSGVFDPPRLAPDFNLQSSNNTPLSLSQTKGKLVVLGFGFSHCTDVCPITLANLARAHQKLDAADAEKMQVLYITVDPENDNPTRLHDYLQVFDKSFIGLTGTEKQLEKVRNEYGIMANKVVGKHGEVAVHHSSYIYLIDPQGYLRALVPFGKNPDDIAHDIKILLHESSAP